MVQVVFDVFLFVADWFLSVLFIHGDVEKLTGTLDHKPVFLNFNVFFYFTFNCATFDLD